MLQVFTSLRGSWGYSAFCMIRATNEYSQQITHWWTKQFLGNQSNWSKKKWFCNWNSSSKTKNPKTPLHLERWIFFFLSPKGNYCESLFFTLKRVLNYRKHFKIQPVCTSTRYSNLRNITCKQSYKPNWVHFTSFK